MTAGVKWWRGRFATPAWTSSIPASTARPTVVTAAVQGDVDVLGVSMKEQGADDLIAGGVMPDEDAAELKCLGVCEVMLQDTPPQAIIDTLLAGRGAR